MLRNKLRTLILKHLRDGPRSGYQLINDIQKHTGWKPSYGSIYPLLDKMRSEGLLTVTQEGRRKLYRLSARGREQSRQLSAQDAELVTRAQESFALIAHILGLDDAQHQELAELFFATLERGDKPPAAHARALADFKIAYWDLHQRGVTTKKKAAITKIIKDATRQLRALAP